MKVSWHFHYSVTFISFGFFLLIHGGEQKNIPVTQLTNHIYRRLYCIKQLKKPMDYIRHIDLDTYPSLLRTIIWEYKTFETQFNSADIKRSFQSMVHQHDIKALLPVWTDFEQYKNLEDHYFEQDVIRMLFIIAKSLCMTTTNENELLVKQAHDITLSQCLETALDLPVDQLVEIIRLIIKFCQSNKKDILYLCEEVQERLGLGTIKHEWNTGDLNVGSQEVLIRYYYIQRLSSLSRIIVKCKQLPCTLSFEDITFTHHCVGKTVHELESKQIFAPLAELFEDFIHYKNVYDRRFCRETLLIFFIVLKNYVVHASKQFSKQFKKSSLIERIMIIYKDINTLPIEEILDAIDLTIEAFQMIQENNEHTPGIAHKTIWKKTWWAQTLGVFLVLLKVIHHYHYYY